MVGVSSEGEHEVQNFGAIADTRRCQSVVEDSRIKVIGHKSNKLYLENMRFVSVYDPDNDTIIDFISNNFEVSAMEISNLYKHRWDIKVFFKCIKQNIVIKYHW